MDYENKRLQKEQHEQIESLKIVQAAASDTESAMALFREIDADGSGQLDEEEFGNLVTCMGKCAVVVVLLCGLCVVYVDCLCVCFYHVLMYIMNWDLTFLLSFTFQFDLNVLIHLFSTFIITGLSMSPEQVRECMSEYDVDNGELFTLIYFPFWRRLYFFSV